MRVRFPKTDDERASPAGQAGGVTRMAPYRLLAGGALATAVVLAALSPAVAGDGLSVSGGIDAASLAPGSERVHEISVANGSGEPARLALRVEDLVQAEGGCLRQEVTVPGEECEADGGELARDLRVTVSHEGAMLWAGALEDLLEDTDLGAGLDAGETWDLDVTTSLDLASPNDTMTDQASFTTVFVATGTVSDEVEVAGVEMEVAGESATGAGPATTGVPTVVAAGARVQLPVLGWSVGLWPLTAGTATLALAAVLAVRRRPGRHRA